MKPAPPAELPLQASPETVKDAAIHQVAGRKLIRDGKFAEAIEELSAAIRLDPTSSHACNARGYAYMRTKRLKEALADFDNAIRLDPKYVNAYQNRAAARRRSGDADGASADLEKSQQLLSKTLR